MASWRGVALLNRDRKGAGRHKLDLQNAIRNIHLYAGLVAGLLFCVMSLSGSLLIFRSAIDKSLRPHWTSNSSARPKSVLSEAVANVHRRWPDAKIVTITLPGSPGDPYEIEMQRSRRMRAFVDNRSGEVLGTHSVPWLAWIVDLHHDLKLGTTKAVGIVGILLFLTSLTGIALSMIRPQKWRTAFRVHVRASWKQLSFEFHRAIGLLSYVLVLVVSLSGIYLGFPDTIQSALGVRPQEQLSTTKARNGTSHPLEELRTAAQEAIPGGIVRQIEFDTQTTFLIWAPGDPRVNGSNRVVVDEATARVLQVDRVSDWGPVKRFTEWITPVHFAEWSSRTVQVLWSLIGLIPPILFVSGALIWLRPFSKRSRFS